MIKKSRFYTHSYSLVKTIKYSCFIAIPIIILNLFIGVFSLLNIRQQNLDSISNSISLFQEEISSKIYSIEHFIQWSTVNEPLFTQMEKSESLADLSTSLNTFRTRVSDSQYVTGTEYQYFLYLEQRDAFFNASELHFNYQEYLSIKHFILNLVHSETSLNNNSSWQSTVIGDTNYLYYLITYKERTFAAFINIADFIEPLTDINLGTDGGLVVTGLQGNRLYSTDSNKNYDSYHGNSLFHNSLSFTDEKESLPIQMTLYIDNLSNYGRLMIFQYVLIFAALLFFLILSIFIFYMYHKVIKPIREFSAKLSNLNEQDDILDLQSNHIQELEQANVQFNNLLHEIHNLKISIYENELSKKRFEITFLQNQIRPHFYLNCLTTISSMAQLGKNEDIQRMVIFTSRYLRYLFQTDRETVCIKYELMHIQSYLDIQALRYGPVFQYFCSIKKEDEDATLPPLLLITFIENTIKHGIAQKGQLQINLIVKSEYVNDSKVLQIDIEDNGQGFPDDVLLKLSHGESLDTDDTHHVGITNSIQRLALLYGTNYHISFYNEENSGAHIKLYIPYHTLEEQA